MDTIYIVYLCLEVEDFVTIEAATAVKSISLRVIIGSSVIPPIGLASFLQSFIDPVK